jgi:hypothetical protein
MGHTSHRTVSFNLSKALGEAQCWAVETFPTIIQRATGYSERWVLVSRMTDEASGTRTWQYEVVGIPEIDLVVDHIIHELSDAVLLSEWHTVTEDRFTFGSLRRDRPARADQTPEQAIGEGER